VVSAVISTPLGPLARQCVAQLLAALDPAMPAQAEPAFLPFEIYVSENI
jgi:hypothetical protein